MAETLILKTLICQMCGHGADPEKAWIPRSIARKPRRCADPKCRSPYWDAAQYPDGPPPGAYLQKRPIITSIMSPSRRPPMRVGIEAAPSAAAMAA